MYEITNTAKKSLTEAKLKVKFDKTGGTIVPTTVYLLSKYTDSP